MGATADADGVNFAVYSAHATAIELCLYDAEGRDETARWTLPGRTGDIWHGYLPGARPGLIYGLRAHGPWAPAAGHRFNARKLLLDPWAREIVGDFEWSDIHRGDDPRDNAHLALKARVIRDDFDWQGDRPPRTPLADSVIYELHVRGYTRRMHRTPLADRGSYAGLVSDAAVSHLKRLGITAVNLLPVQQALSEERLARMGLTNYWGYNTIGFFCPDPRLASTARPRDEFRQMVRTLHRHGIEVLLDVVYNHTAESDESGPTLCWRGLDNANWYRSPGGDPARYENWTGCGNTVNLQRPQAVRMVIDSLRYWVEEMHVDGFRFDLATVLGRADTDFSRDAPFFSALQRDPVLQQVKLIAEPWDPGPAGYRLGQFPNGWLEWNDRFRDTARAYWLRGDCSRGEFARRFAGSADLFQSPGRSPLESLNYVVSHDGFTLADLLSHDRRHNEANGEDNRDGAASNLSWNCGVEGRSTDPEVAALRSRLQRALLATLLLSQGTPMVSAGDEIGHGQRGNNNPYCQDNETSWIDWARADHALAGYTAHLIALRRRLLLPRAARWFSGAPTSDLQAELSWFGSDGNALTSAEWEEPAARALGARYGAGADRQQEPPLLLLINAGDIEIDFLLPPGNWQAELDTSQSDGRSSWRRGDAASVAVRARCLVLLSAAAEPSRTAGQQAVPAR